MQKLQSVIFYLFSGLLFLVPLVLWPFTSEVFEFNKIIIVYIFTTLITGVWLVESIIKRKIVFRRTILDIPLFVFLGSQLASTLFSIDPLTSWLGYYSRFNGGLVSIICYSLLYWAFVSHFAKDEVKKLFWISVASAILVALYGVLEHFGIDKNVWVQDVQSRVFSTLGQPNWLAAYLVALLPLAWSNTITSYQSTINNKFSISKNYKFLIYFCLSALFFWTLIFTKSRSGILGFGLTFIIFWGLYFWKIRKEFKSRLSPFIIIGSSLLVISLISGTQYTPSFTNILNGKKGLPTEASAKVGPALEIGGTESGTIRKIVWKGAFGVWKRFPIFGSGPETFAYSYYLERPAEHNLVSEWDFIYNKAHNEYLNILANSGTVGLLSYLGVIVFSIVAITNYQLAIGNKLKSEKLTYSLKIENWELKIGLLAGFVSLLVTNFFGFSVTPTQLIFFLFPAAAFSYGKSREDKAEKNRFSVSRAQRILIVLVATLTAFSLFCISRYWYADTLFARGKSESGKNKIDLASKDLGKATAIMPSQPLYHNELANVFTKVALAFSQQGDADNTKRFVEFALAESDKAIALSPANVNLKRARTGIFIMLSTIDAGFITKAQENLIETIKQAPTDAKLYYNLGLTYARSGQPAKAEEMLKKAVELKANYKEARLAYGILLINEGKNSEARPQLEYILSKIDPNDSLTKQALESIK